MLARQTLHRFLRCAGIRLCFYCIIIGFCRDFNSCRKRKSTGKRQCVRYFHFITVSRKKSAVPEKLPSFSPEHETDAAALRPGVLLTLRRLRQHRAGPMPCFRVDLRQRAADLRFIAEVGIRGDEQLSFPHNVAGLAEAASGKDTDPCDKARTRRDDIPRRFPVVHRLRLRPFADDDCRAGTVLRHGQPLQLRDAEEHVVFDPLRLDRLPVGPEADAKRVQLPEDFLRRHALISGDLIKPDEARQRRSHQNGERQQERKQRPLLHPRKCGGKAAALHQLQIAH